MWHPALPAPPLPVQVAKFMAKYGNLNMFPVKVQVPIMFTVYVLVQFKSFKIMAPDGSAAAAGKPDASQGFFKRGASASSSTPLPADFFEVPEGCQRYEPKSFAKAEVRGGPHGCMACALLNAGAASYS